jgi:alpha-L-rhamnosidase
MQTSYRILVSEDKKSLKPGKAEAWDSDWIDSDKSVFVKYEGDELESGKRYYWNVLIRDNRAREVKSAEPAYFETGLLNKSDWQASWIGYEAKKEKDLSSAKDTDRPRSILLRREFQTDSRIDKARIYISGLGNYELIINGEKIGKDLLTPGWTDYHKRVQYQSYDITDNIIKGENAVGIILGNMWWSGGLGWSGEEVYSKGPLRAIAQIEIRYNNGRSETIITDSSWRAYPSPLIDNSLYHGETWDARLEIPMWAEAGLEDSKWYPVETFQMDTIELSAQYAPPIRVMDTIRPISVKEVKPGIYVYDMGVNMVGFARITASGNNGDTITLRFAELLHDDGTVAQENLRSARATDRYIMKGTGTESWQPSFTYHGFRYVQVEGFPGVPDTDNLKGLQIYSSASDAGTFTSSNQMLNTIWENLVRGQKGNMHSVPTDCPQRDERLGWMGDAQIFAPTACYNMDMSAFFAKWMRDITDSQHKSGYVFDVNPAIVVDGPSKAGWGDAVTVVPMVMYKFYNDRAILVDNYEGMKAWVEYMRRKSEDHIYRWSEKEGDWEGYGDWIAVEESPVEPISAAYYFYSTRLLSEAAGIIGKKEDEKKYSSLADSISQAFHEEFFDEGKINYPGATQTANLLPLVFGLSPPEYEKDIASNIISDVRERGNHPSTGFLGTAYLLPVLSDYGEHELAYETAINEEYPSWAYMVNQGATTMWELWNSDKEPPHRMNSRNHFALGSVVEWYYSHLAGIRPLKPGFKKILIKPLPPQELDWVEANYNSPYGRIHSSWKKENSSFRQKVVVPPNTSARVVIPLQGLSLKELRESGNIMISDGKVNENEFIKVSGISEKEIILDVPSGSYGFEVIGE